MTDPLPAGMRFERSFLARFALRGSDGRDFLHRLTTNEVEGLQEGQGTPALLLERTGRVVDRLIVADRGDDFLLLGNRGRSAAVREWIERYTIAEDVRLEDLADTTRLITVLGERAPAVIAARVGVAAIELAPYEHRTVEHAGAPVTVIRAEDVGGRSFHLMTSSGGAGALGEALAELDEGTEGEYRAHRIRAGVPGFGDEYTERTIPLETRMNDAISFTKGCYVGQEVIARLHNYDRVKRALVRLRVEGAGAPEAGARILDGEKEIGVITSAAAFDDAVFALAYVQAKQRVPGGRFRVDTPGAPRAAEVLTLTPAGDPS